MNKPHHRDLGYFTINIMVEDEDGDLVVVFRADHPFESVEQALEEVDGIIRDGSLSFDRMDD